MFIIGNGAYELKSFQVAFMSYGKFSTLRMEKKIPQRMKAECFNQKI